MTKGKVVLIRFPFDDLSAGKVRPAVCLTNPMGVHRHVVLAFICTNAIHEHEKMMTQSSEIIAKAAAWMQGVGILRPPGESHGDGLHADYRRPATGYASTDVDRVRQRW